MFFGGIEAGGTKFVCGIADSGGEIVDHIQIPTTAPGETISKIVDYFMGCRNRFAWSRIGLASFGPLDLDENSPTYGFITSTPKQGWQNFDIRGAVSGGLKTDVVLDTDVNAAALAEFKWGAGRGKNPVVYLTIGTGIGGGAVIDGKPLHGLAHPEMGHMRISRANFRDDFPGVCPYHKDCLEGLASGPALLARWGIPGDRIPPSHPAWQLEAGYLAEGISNLVLALSPQIIILGGGVMKNEFLFPMIRTQVQQILNDYVKRFEISQRIDEYIVPPGLKNFAGLKGAVALVSG